MNTLILLATCGFEGTLGAAFIIRFYLKIPSQSTLALQPWHEELCRIMRLEETSWPWVSVLPLSQLYNKQVFPLSFFLSAAWEQYWFLPSKCWKNQVSVKLLRAVSRWCGSQFTLGSVLEFMTKDMVLAVCN